MSNFFSIFLANKIFKFFFIKRDPIRYYYFINIYIYYWNKFFMLIKFLILEFSISKFDTFFHFYIYFQKFILFEFIIFHFYICCQKFIFFKRIIFHFFCYVSESNLEGLKKASYTLGNETFYLMLKNSYFVFWRTRVFYLLLFLFPIIFCFFFCFRFFLFSFFLVFAFLQMFVLLIQFVYFTVNVVTTRATD